MNTQTCYHCGLPLSSRLDLTVNILGEQHAMCCAGCQAVAQAIVDAGLEDYYKHRSEKAGTAKEALPDFLAGLHVYDNPHVQKRFVRAGEGENREADLILEGITCAACIWLNEQRLRNLPGVLEVRINYSTRRALVRWDNSRIQLSNILEAISRIGYFAHPYDPARRILLLEEERRHQLKRLGIAGVLGMQIMMISVALYSGAWSGMDGPVRDFFHWVNLLLVIPILVYCAEPFFKNAWHDLRRGQAGMDVPVSLGIGLAFAGSLWATMRGTGEVYYDSIAMFVFFLLGARYFEFIARRRSTYAAESLVRLVPETALRLRQNREEEVAVADLQVGDIVLIKPGQTVPADGSVSQGRSAVDESLMSGESRPSPKKPGASLVAGSINIDSPLQMQVEKIGADTVLSHILSLLDRAQSEKPALTRLADKIAAYFVFGVLLLACAVATYWWLHPVQDWLRITLSVLVVTCPCALSLATPAAITAATDALTRAGLLATRGHALETLAQADYFVFDKTGTLTEGRLRLLHTHLYGNDSANDSLRHAAALESHSEHHLGKALRAALGEQDETLQAEEVHNQPGAGLAGKIGGIRWYAGNADFIRQHGVQPLPPDQLKCLQDRGDTLVFLARQQVIQAVFSLGDSLREGAKETIAALHAQGKRTALLSGDQHAAVEKAAQAAGITEYAANLSPQDKLDYIKRLQSQGHTVAMLGDGVNDAPVLAQAQISIAMGGGTQIARAGSDMILLGDKLQTLLQGLGTARATVQVIRQNLTWALLYNLCALPAAAAGWVAPWMAAIGMSLSSLLVVANALRLRSK